VDSDFPYSSTATPQAADPEHPPHERPPTRQRGRTWPDYTASDWAELHADQTITLYEGDKQHLHDHNDDVTPTLELVKIVSRCRRGERGGEAELVVVADDEDDL